MRFFKILLVLILLRNAAPTLAQEGNRNRISFNDFSFTIDSALGTQVSITQFQSSPADVFPAQGAHTRIVVYGEQAPDSSIVGIRVYQVAELAKYAHLQQQVIQLQQLLRARRDLAEYAASTANPLPFLPAVAAGQTIRARVRYLGTAAVSGISYVTAYQQAAEPLVQRDFLYTFQGISADGRYYISVVFRVSPESFPTTISAEFDYQSFLASLPAYLSESTAQLNSAAPESFAPALPLIDDLVQSFDFAS